MQPAVALTGNNLVLGRYRPLRPLGSGGGGSVWLAHDEEAGRNVALKVVEREGKPGARAEREVDAATMLRHPRCLRALALARDERHVYVAYPYVAGQTLREALRGGAVDDWSAVESAAQVLEALAHAHSKGIVHRDVKPANVMLEDGDEVSVKLLDFGLAQLEHADTLTAVGDVPGTLAYIAPERLAGEEATGAADVWAVGVILWESLAGRHPFWAVSPLETARRVEGGAQPLVQLRPDLPQELCRAVDRMLSLDPRKRPTARQALNLLRTAEERTRSAAPCEHVGDRPPRAGAARRTGGPLRRRNRIPPAVLPLGLALPARRPCRTGGAAQPDCRPRGRAARPDPPAGERLPRARRRLRAARPRLAAPVRPGRPLEPVLPGGPRPRPRPPLAARATSSPFRRGAPSAGPRWASPPSRPQSQRRSSSGSASR